MLSSRSDPRLAPGLSRRSRSRAAGVRGAVPAPRGARSRMSGAEAVGLVVALAAVRATCWSRCCARSGSEMTAAGWIEIALYFAILTALTPLLGAYMARVYRRRCWIARRARRARRYRLLGSAAARAGLEGLRASRCSIFSAVFFGVLYLILRTQGIHPWNPQDLARRRGTSRSTRRRRSSRTRTGSTTRGETTLSYFSQMAGLAVQNFVSAAVGIAVRDRVHPRARRALGPRASATSTATSSGRSSTCCCRSRSSSACSWSRRA